MEVKTKLIDLCIKEQMEKIDTLNEAVKTLQKNANDYGTPKDRYDSYRAQMLRKKDMFSKQLAKAKDIIDVFGKISLLGEIDTADFGAIVETDKLNFFISTGLGEIELEGKKYFAVSPLVPIVKAMRGMKAGDQFSFNNVTYVIKSIR
jgi:hypothetical protein